MDPQTSLTPPYPAAAGVICRCCQSNNVNCLGAKKSAFTTRSFEFYVCRNCSFQFVEPVEDFTIYNDAYYAGKGPDPTVNYEEEYRDYAAGDRILEYEDLLRIVRNCLELRDDDESLKWLDFGSGAGGLLRYLRDHVDRIASGKQLQLFGHDVGTYAVRLAQNDGFSILSLDDLQSMEGVFHVISCIDVIEHLPTPAPVIGLFGQLLRPGGVLLLTTGNMHSPAARWRGIHF